MSTYTPETAKDMWAGMISTHLFRYSSMKWVLVEADTWNHGLIVRYKLYCHKEGEIGARIDIPQNVLMDNDWPRMKQLLSKDLGELPD